MRLLRRIWRKLHEQPRRVEVVKPSPRAERLAAHLQGTAALGTEARRAVDRIRSSMRERQDHHDDPNYPTVALHFAKSSSGETKLALLQQLVGYRGAKSVLELGTAYGLSSIAMAKTKEQPQIVTIEFAEPQATLGRENLRAAGVAGVECVKGDKVEVLPRFAAEGRRFDFVFHDGGHSGDFYVSDFALIAPMLEPESLCVIDDIAWDDKPEIRAITAPHSRRTCFEGWQELLTDPRVDGALVVGRNVGILLTR